jgi:ABC-type glutathione transport system ATPase component
LYTSISKIIARNKTPQQRKIMFNALSTSSFTDEPGPSIPYAQILFQNQNFILYDYISLGEIVYVETKIKIPYQKMSGL